MGKATSVKKTAVQKYLISNFEPGGEYRRRLSTYDSMIITLILSVAIVKLFVDYELWRPDSWAMGTGWLVSPWLVSP